MQEVEGREEVKGGDRSVHFFLLRDQNWSEASHEASLGNAKANTTLTWVYQTRENEPVAINLQTELI